MILESIRGCFFSSSLVHSVATHIAREERRLL
jgi:hypothetical protein